MGEWDLDYLHGKNGLNSIPNYLIDLCGEETVYQLMLFPDTVQTVTGKTWDEHKEEWYQHMQDKSADVDFSSFGR